MSESDPSRTDHLAAQQIDENGPGTILKDFETLLTFLEDGVRSTGKYHLLPMARLFELDELMEKPLRPRQKRPQQRSFPHINGLYLLLRATQLGVPEGHGKTSGRLKLNASLRDQWLQLNATERYFNLLEAWLRRSSFETLGLGHSGWTRDVAQYARDLWRAIPARGRRFSEDPHASKELLYNTERFCTLGLLELFGLMTVERGQPVEGQSWHVTRVRHTPFGDELLRIVFAAIGAELFSHKQREFQFGEWQPLLQSYFPQWVNNLEFPRPEFRDGVHYFKVSLGKPWRRIAIPAKSDLDELAEYIIHAFDFGGDHLYAFHYVAPDGRSVEVAHPYIDDADMYTDELAIGELPLNEGDSMVFSYDFGADWQFNVRFEKVKPDAGEITEATIVDSRGEAPPEYEYDDEW